MTVLHLGAIGAGWFTAGFVWWWVLARLGFRFETRDQDIPTDTGVRATLRDRAASLERDRATRRADRAVLN